ncbi:MAG: helix-turn-helix domain-containing protein [Solirubrobacteraceae bacterium]
MSSTPSELFAANLKRLREERGWSQEELSRRSRLHTTAISKLERGRRAPRFPTIIRLAETFEIPVGALFDGIDFSPDTPGRGGRTGR